MENIYNYTKFTNFSRVKQFVYPLYFTRDIYISTAVHRKPRKKYRPGVKYGIMVGWGRGGRSWDSKSISVP